MPKSAVFPYILFTRFVDEPTIKRLSLFFDDILISEARLNQILNFNLDPKKEENKFLIYEKATWEFLIDNKIVKPYPFIPAKFENPEGEEENSLIEAYKETIPPPNAPEADISKLSEKEKEELRRELMNHFFYTHDISNRLDAIQLRKTLSNECFPVLRTNGSFHGQEKKSSVIQFLLDEIPEPDPNTSWEQIIDYRSDNDVRVKYLALINWANKAALSPSSISDLKDEYEYLYYDYLKHFKLHKLKYNNSTLELIVNASTSLLLAFQSGAFVPAFKNLLQMNLSHIKLAEDEAKIPGKEIAYIYHTKQTFQKH